MPFPPPPPAAFSMSGKPISLATFSTSASEPRASSDPGTTGTPALRMSRRADEDEARVGARLGERRALGEEAVAGVDGLGAGFLRGRDQLVDAEVALGSSGRPDRIGVVGLAHVEGAAVRLRVDGDRFDTELATGAHDAHGDLAAVRHQDTLEELPGSAVRAGCCHASWAGSGR